MPEEIVPPVFNPQKFVEARNAGKEVERAVPGKPEEAKPLDKEAQEEQTERNLPRHVRREMNKLREEAAFARGQLEAMKAMGAKPEVKEAAKVEDPEPKRADFPEGTAGDAHDVKLKIAAMQEETKRVLATKEESEASTRQIQAAIEQANKNFAKDMETYKPEWEKVLAETAEDEDAPKFDPNDQPGLTMLLATSEVQMPIWTYLAKNPEQLQKLIDLKDKPTEQIQLFRRLEGRSESMYTMSKKEVAQASGNTEKEAQNNAHSSEKAGQARAKPRPTADVAARGGSAASELPKPGTKEWVMMRNEMYSKKT